MCVWCVCVCVCVCVVCVWCVCGVCVVSVTTHVRSAVCVCVCVCVYDGVNSLVRACVVYCRRTGKVVCTLKRVCVPTDVNVNFC